MAKYKKRPVIVDATQWFKNRDHPLDGKEMFEKGEFKGELLEGKVVRYYRDPYANSQYQCLKCGHIMHEHGWIEDGQIVCPGDWIVTDREGKHYPKKPDIFKATHIACDEQNAEYEPQETLM